MKKFSHRFWFWILQLAWRRVAPPMKQKPVGLPLYRDPFSPCEAYEPRPVKPGDFTDCQTDGHYLCRQCCHRDQTLDAEVIEV